MRINHIIIEITLRRLPLLAMDTEVVSETVTGIGTGTLGSETSEIETGIVIATETAKEMFETETVIVTAIEQTENGKVETETVTVREKDTGIEETETVTEEILETETIVTVDGEGIVVGRDLNVKRETRGRGQDRN